MELFENPITKRSQAEVIPELREFFSQIFPADFFDFDSFYEVSFPKRIGTRRLGWMTDMEKFLLTASTNASDRCKELEKEKRSLREGSMRLQEVKRSISRLKTIAAMIFNLMQCLIVVRLDHCGLPFFVCQGWEIVAPSSADSANGTDSFGGLAREEKMETSIPVPFL